MGGERRQRRVEKEWRMFRKRIEKTIDSVEREEKGYKREKERREWRDEECKEAKNRVRKELRKWRKFESEGVRYKEERENIGNCVRRKEERKERNGRGR